MRRVIPMREPIPRPVKAPCSLTRLIKIPEKKTAVRGGPIWFITSEATRNNPRFDALITGIQRNVKTTIPTTASRPTFATSCASNFPVHVQTKLFSKTVLDFEKREA